MAETASRAETIADELRNEILHGRRRPGERLSSERDLATRFGANRSSIREALKKLEQLRLIEIRPGGGARVIPVEQASLDVLDHLLVVAGQPDPVIAEQCLEVLELLFTGAVRFAVERGTDDELARARDLLSVISARDTDDGRYLEAFTELMELIHAASQNLVLQLVQNSMRSLFADRPELLDTRPPREQLEGIAREIDLALADRDAAAAQEGVRRLVRAARERLLKVLEAERTSAEVEPNS